MKIGIVIPTYQRPDNKTKFYLERALASVENQTHKDYHVFVIGDKYEDDNEFNRICSKYPNLTKINLLVAIERSKYAQGDYRLYCAGGTNAYQTGVKMALQKGFEYICVLNHDDWWEPNHLAVISKVIEEKHPFFITTISEFIDGNYLPAVPVNKQIRTITPKAGKICTSATCMKYSETKLRAEDQFEKTGKAMPGDAALWDAMAKEMKVYYRQGYFIPEITCHHTEDGYSRTKENNMSICLITPTGARAQQFAFCQYFMKRQTYKGSVLWIIVDDCSPVTTDQVKEDFRENWEIKKIYPTPVWNEGMNTQGRNIREAINYIKQRKDIDKVFIIEDDDYYKPNYLEEMMKRFGTFDLIGEKFTIYYHALLRRYFVNPNDKHASLFQIAFTFKMIPIFERCLDEKFIDYVFCSLVHNKSLFTANNLAIGMKGMPGRGGIGAGHKGSLRMKEDLNFTFLKSQIGDDILLYAKFYAERNLMNPVIKVNSIKDVTGIVVSHNTVNLLKRAYESVRKFHPNMRIIIIDGSDKNDPCRKYVETLPSNVTTVAIADYNIGHGRGMDAAIKMVQTKFALIFDSDIEMLKSPVEQMLKLVKDDTYGVGYIELTGKDGFEYGAHSHHSQETPTKYLHPYFMLLQVSEYAKYPKFVHHGAPCYQAMNAIKQAGLSDRTLVEFPGLGHSSGKGWNWTGQPREFIRHDTAGTRKDRKSKGKSEIEGVWQYVQS